jgi:drug/metabolite transporter (DMT)-like permease
VISFDGLLVRLQHLSPAGITFWRGILTGIAFAVMVPIARRISGDRTPIMKGSGPMLLIAFLMLIGTLTWIFSVTHTTIANTLLIIACSPIATGILGRFLLKEHLPLRTWLAGVAALAGVVIVVSGNLSARDLQGDAYAVGNVIALALILILLRRFQNVDRVLALSISGFAAAAVVAPWGISMPDSQTWLAAAADGLVVVPGGLVMIFFAPRYLPAAEVGLLLLLETVLAPLWVLLALGEQLTVQVVFSAAIILGAIVIHSILDLRKEPVARVEAKT